MTSNMGKRRSYSSGRKQFERKQEQKPDSSAMAELMAEAEETDRRAKYREEHQRVPKPRAVRRYERYSNMGGEDGE